MGSNHDGENQARGSCSASHPNFDPTTHLAFQPPDKIYSWEHLGFPIHQGVAPFCAAEPFRLFSAEAIRIMRAEVLHPQVLRDYAYSDDNTGMSTRGFASKHAPFTTQVWKHPRTLALLSEVAGIDLAVRMDYELGHLNFGVESGKKLRAVQTEATDDQSRRQDDGDQDMSSEGGGDKDDAILGWHKDSYPFSVTLMLSDSAHTTGGEIALERADGTTRQELRPAETGAVVLLQGRHVRHTGLRARGGAEMRVTMVTPLWPASSSVCDDTFLTYTGAISDTSVLYAQYAAYRFEMLVDRLVERRRALEDGPSKGVGTKLDIEVLKEFIAAQVRFLQQTNGEILEENLIDSWGYKKGIPVPESVLGLKETITSPYM